MGNALHLPKPYWILMTVLFVTQNGYGATRVRIVHRAAGTLAGLTIAGLTLHFPRSGELHPERDAADYPAQLSDHSQNTMAGRWLDLR
ncbi:YccS/YhfK family integral membrane protein [Klebsiella pneumoniae]|uniref:YccS/YhfK family integral membrane protein n=1 Tax=Klebsiella pneumoniae TaxID=573 RepID=A0A2X3EX03_KLEPN|nr:YccS/YhfK family integral membrane protein [Klebsiella pneumoniae]